MDVSTYYEDPVLTFEDSLIYGCSLQLTLDELEDFCTRNMFTYMMLWQNLFGVEKVGISGNAD